MALCSNLALESRKKFDSQSKDLALTCSQAATLARGPDLDSACRSIPGRLRSGSCPDVLCVKANVSGPVVHRGLLAVFDVRTVACCLLPSALVADRSICGANARAAHALAAV